ncbi:hypothetical protein BDZ91DRAFT_733532 [Kalaharituber pfeilii]|nr:hypothetical protein BDZ91DRAFT_733532 [Kalaharituber pfeilii]
MRQQILLIHEIHCQDTGADPGMEGGSSSSLVRRSNQRFLTADSRPCQTLHMGTIPFDLIIRHPADALAWGVRKAKEDFATGKELIENVINGFLKDLFNLDSTTNTVHQSPLVYDNHAPFEDDSAIAIRVRLRDPQANVMVETARVCDRIHSLDARDAKVCQTLSKLDIFGFEPVKETYFAICWDSAFFYQLLTDGQRMLNQFLTQASQAADTLTGCEWLQICCFIFMEIASIKEGKSIPSWARLAKTVLARSGHDIEKVIKSVQLLVCQVLKVIVNCGGSTAKIEEWKIDVDLAKRSLDTVKRRMEGLLTTNLSRDDHEILDGINRLYFAFRSAMKEAARLITRNKEIWKTFETQWLMGLAGAGVLGIATTTRLLWTNVVAHTMPTVGVAVSAGLSLAAGGIALFWGLEGKQKAKLCKSLDECLSLCSEVVFNCDMLTKYVYLVQKRVHNSAALQDVATERHWKALVEDVLLSTGQDPTSAGFTLEIGYREYMSKQKKALTEALNDLADVNEQIQNIKT